MRKNDKPTGLLSRRLLNVLLVEDSPADGLLLQRALTRGGFDCAVRRVQTLREMEEALEEQSWDVILADHALPQFSAPQALALVVGKGLDLPFIIVSGHIEEETAVAAMRAGAHDYVMKDNLARLVPAVERELREAEVRRARNRYEEALRQAREELETRVRQRTHELEEANRRLQEAMQERRRLENELLEIAENERRRIGLDLHDDLGQKLTGAALMLKGLEQRLRISGHSSCAEAQQVQSLVNEIISHTHQLAREFSSLQAVGQDLETVLRTLAANVQRMFGVTCGFKLVGEVPVLPEDTILQLHKIAQEAVSNAVKHGKATRVNIGVRVDDGQVKLAVENDGLPFSVPERSRTRLGLRIMNYRANTIGGTLDIRPAEGSGTRVTCCVPLVTSVGRGREEGAGVGMRA